MKKLWLIMALVGGAGVFIVPSRAVSLQQDNVGKFMQQKLKHSQSIMEGLCVEDFEMIADNAKKLSAFSKAAEWDAIKTPEYAILSSEFRRVTDDLSEAAENENLDGATLAYVAMTVKCVNCHKYVRGVRVANAEPATPESDLRTVANLIR